METKLTFFNNQWYAVVLDETGHCYYLGAWTQKQDAESILKSYLSILKARGV